MSNKYCPFLPGPPQATKIIDEGGDLYALDTETGLFTDKDGAALSGAVAMASALLPKIEQKDPAPEPDPEDPNPPVDEPTGPAVSTALQPEQMLSPCIRTQCALYDQANNRCGLSVSDLIMEELRYWAAAASQKPPAATKLVNEYMGNEDLDGNGLIYGFDFHITDGRPPMLDALPQEGNEMTWVDYKKSLQS